MRTLFARVAAAMAAMAALAALSGCISLLPKEKPVQLYRFGIETPQPAATANISARVTMRAAPTSFQRAAAADLILTVSGDQTAYLGGVRWVTDARDLFDAAVTRAFQGTPGPARLLARGEPAAADYVLKLDVRLFEVRYDRGLGTRPTVVVEVYAALVGHKQNTDGVSRVFHAEAPASSNAVHAIAAAFDSAVGTVLGEIVHWVEATATA